MLSKGNFVLLCARALLSLLEMTWTGGYLRHCEHTDRSSLKPARDNSVGFFLTIRSLNIVYQAWIQQPAVRVPWSPFNAGSLLHRSHLRERTMVSM